MSIQSLLTSNSKVLQIQQLYTASLLKFNDKYFSTIYCFLSRLTPFVNSDNTPLHDQKTLKEIQKNIFFVKKVLSNNISPVIERIDWKVNTVYDYYKDSIDLFSLDESGKLVNKFYIKNRYDQVFKCLFNNNANPSTQEPYFEPGNYKNNNIFIGSNDGYKWKYMYTIDIGSKNKFMDVNWMPVFDNIKSPNPLLYDYGYGAIEVINVINSGNNYLQNLTSNVWINISGDGVGCTAKPYIIDGNIVDIIVTNPGKNYTHATATVINDGASANGSGSIIETSVSPIGGHSSFPVSELGCHNIMYVCEFNGSENNTLPTDIIFYQAGLINNPISLSSSPEFANNESYSVSTDLIVSKSIGSYISGEIVYQGDSLNTADAYATVLSFDLQTSLLKLININGLLNTKVPIIGNTSNTSKTVLSIIEPDFIPFSGYISYIENFDGIQRTVESNEQIKIILGY